MTDPSQTQRRRPVRTAPRGVVLVCLLGALLASACGPWGRGGALDAGTAGVIETLESLAFVPSGRTALDIDVGVDVDLVVDRFEVTESIWTGLFGEDDPRPENFASFVGRQVGAAPPEAWILQAPAVGMNLDEARQAARLRGMRLPTFEEWLWCAAGPRSRRFPAGRQQRGLANTLDLGLVRPTPVGAFESGQTPDTGIFDLLGNVWEWTEPPPPLSGWKTIDADAWPVGGGSGAPAWILGGSFSTPEKVLFTRDGVALAMGRTTGHRGADLGMRCVMEAIPFLVSLAEPGSGLPQAARARVVAVGARWGSRSVDALEAARAAAPESAWVEALLEGAGRGREATGGDGLDLPDRDGGLPR